MLTARCYETAVPRFPKYMSSSLTYEKKRVEGMRIYYLLHRRERGITDIMVMCLEGGSDIKKDAVILTRVFVHYPRERRSYWLTF